MTELLLLLVGARIVRRKWWIVGLIGLAWMALGLFFFADAFIDEIRIPPTYFAIPLLVDSAISLASALNGTGSERTLRLARAAWFVGIALLLVDAPWHSDMIIGLLAGMYLIVDAAWCAASAFVVRYARWRLSMFNAGIEFLLGVWALVPWPTQWRAAAGGHVGILVVASAIGICTLALRLRHLPPGMPMSTILTRGWPSSPEEALPTEDAGPPAPDSASAPEPGTVTVHVWTPTGALVPINHGVSRYVAAQDKNGIISTGHAALEAPPDIYVSHYPAVEINRSPSDFARTLRATPDNDVPGLFQPSYREESASWCPSTRQVKLPGLDIAAIRAFWAAYRRDSTYNLTNRNCSSAVAKALDAGLEGLFARQARSPYFLLRLLFTPELWVAGVLRRRAAAMAWTPGIVLDYARALSHVIALPGRLGGKLHRSMEQTR